MKNACGSCHYHFPLLRLKWKQLTGDAACRSSEVAAKFPRKFPVCAGRATRSRIRRLTERVDQEDWFPSESAAIKQTGRFVGGKSEGLGGAALMCVYIRADKTLFWQMRPQFQSCASRQKRPASETERALARHYPSALCVICSWALLNYGPRRHKTCFRARAAQRNIRRTSPSYI